MKRIHWLLLGAMLACMPGVMAQQTTAGPDAQAIRVPPVEQHLAVLTEKLGLTADQQARVRPMVQELHDSMQAIVDDASLTHQERMEKIKPLRMKADKELRTVLDDDQKKKLDQLEAEPHPDLHGDADGHGPTASATDLIAVPNQA